MLGNNVSPILIARNEATKQSQRWGLPILNEMKNLVLDFDDR
jgi:hypothetical protein